MWKVNPVSLALAQVTGQLRACMTRSLPTSSVPMQRLYVASFSVDVPRKLRAPHVSRLRTTFNQDLWAFLAGERGYRNSSIPPDRLVSVCWNICAL